MATDSTWSATTILNMSTGYWQSCALHAAVKLNIFTILTHECECRSAREVASLLECDERGVSTLLDALAAMELLKKTGKCYLVGKAAKRFLVSGSSEYLGNIIMHHHHLVDGWAQLEQAVRNGKPVEKRDHGEEQERESFQLGMFNLAMTIAPKLAEQIDLQGRRHLLDLGGGPGTYAIHFCQANPNLCATIVDRPMTHNFADQAIRFFGLKDRINFLADDFTRASTKGKYDVVWLSHILHGYGPAECRRIIAGAVESLTPGGMIMIHEFFMNEAKDGPLFPALFSLNMLINNPAGRSYSENEIGEMLTENGARDLQRLPLVGLTDSYVLCGRA
ncbi:methyltransferase [Thermodesulfobacteriota bacterium]